MDFEGTCTGHQHTQGNKHAHIDTGVPTRLASHEIRWNSSKEAPKVTDNLGTQKGEVNWRYTWLNMRIKAYASIIPMLEIYEHDTTYCK